SRAAPGAPSRGLGRRRGAEPVRDALPRDRGASRRPRSRFGTDRGRAAAVAGEILLPTLRRAPSPGSNQRGQLTLRRRPANQSEEEDDAMRKRIATSALLLSLLTFGLATAEERDTYKAMWLSIAHPGLGEYYLKGWGSSENCPQKKFWLG